MGESNAIPLCFLCQPRSFALGRHHQGLERLEYRHDRRLCIFLPFRTEKRSQWCLSRVHRHRHRTALSRAKLLACMESNNERSNSHKLLQSPAGVAGIIAAYALMTKTFLVDAGGYVLQDICHRARDILRQREYSTKRGLVFEEFEQLESNLLQTEHALAQTSRYLEVAEKRWEDATNKQIELGVTADECEESVALAREKRETLEQLTIRLENLRQSSLSKKLKEEIDILSTESEQKKSFLSQYERNLDEARARFGQLKKRKEEETAVVREGLQILSGQISVHQNRLESLIAQKKATEDDIAALQRHIEALRDKATAMDKERRSLQNQLQHQFETQGSSASNATSSLDPEFRQHRLDLEECLENIEILRVVLASDGGSSDQLSTLKEKLEACDASIEDLRTKLAQTTNALNENRRKQPTTTAIQTALAGNEHQAGECDGANDPETSKSELSTITNELSVIKKAQAEALSRARVVMDNMISHDPDDKTEQVGDFGSKNVTKLAHVSGLDDEKTTADKAPEASNDLSQSTKASTEDSTILREDSEQTVASLKTSDAKSEVRLSNELQKVADSETEPQSMTENQGSKAFEMTDISSTATHGASQTVRRNHSANDDDVVRESSDLQIPRNMPTDVRSTTGTSDDVAGISSSYVTPKRRKAGKGKKRARRTADGQ